MSERKGEWRKLDEAVNADLFRCAQGPGINGPQVIVDTMEQVKCMANGKHYDSKKRYYDELRAQDCHVVEKGEIHSDMNYKRQLVGDFDVTGDLKYAVQKHLR